MRNRNGFTLVELLVVILIIAVLVSLIASAIMTVMNKIPQVRTSTEIAQLSASVRSFMSDYSLGEAPPSRLLLYETIAAYTADKSPLALQSYTFLQRAFGKNIGSQGSIDWNGDGLPNGPWYLEGEQCLVFYCGGIPSVSGTTGFSSNNMNPAIPGGKRRGPYFDFQVPRLVLWPGLSPFPVYIDSWESRSARKPYAYFSAQGSRNGYSNIANGYLTIDCAAISAVPYSQPYVLTATTDSLLNKSITYINPDSFQIISAGRDGVFAQAKDLGQIFGLIPAPWSPTGGGPGSPYPPTPPGLSVIGLAPVPMLNSSTSPAINDDQSNFSGAILGSPQS